MRELWRGWWNVRTMREKRLLLVMAALAAVEAQAPASPPVPAPPLPADAALVPSGFPVFPDPWDYTLETSVRVRERVSIVLGGNGRKPVDRPFVHTGRAELRAAF